MSLVRTAKHAPTRGRDIEIRVAVLPPGERIKPYVDGVEEITVANGGNAIAKGATSIPVTALTANVIKIAKGQVIRFVDQVTGKEYLAYVSEDATAGDASLSVDALDEAIPDTAVGEFPAYVWDRTDSSVSKSYSFSGVTTYNSGDNEDGTNTGSTSDMTLPGIDYHYNDGLKTVIEAAKLGQEFWVTRTKPAPNDAFERGELKEGAATIANDNEGAPADAFQSRDIDVKFVGAVTDLRAKPKA